MECFCQRFNLESLIHTSACFKNSKHLWSIDLIMADSPLSFQSLSTIETGLSDFQKNHNYYHETVSSENEAKSYYWDWQ